MTPARSRRLAVVARQRRSSPARCHPRRAAARAARAALLGLVTMGAASVASAQDAHYWTYGYGPIGQLTEGTLVGGVSDLSAVYYNPGALALLDRPRFVVGLTSVEFANIEVRGVAGQGLDADQLVFDIVPSIVAGQVGGDDGPDRFAFAFLSRHDSDWDLGVSRTNVSAAPDAVAGFGRVRQRLVEYWVGGTWSHRFSERFSVGISPFLAYRAQRSRRSVESEQISGGAAQATFVGSEHEYNHGRVLAKAGLAWRPGAWELGLTATAPGFGVWSQGKVVWNASTTGAPGASPFLSASVQKGLAATYHAPWSLAGGATWRRGGTAIHSTAEWFSAVAAYDILTPEPAPIAGSTETVSLTYRGESDDVFCYGFGLEQRLGDRVVIYGGAAHNESAHVPQRDSFAAWDLTDVTFGLTLATGRATLAFGLGYAWGSNPIPQAVAPPGQSGTVPSGDAHFSRWMLSFGASFR